MCLDNYYYLCLSEIVTKDCKHILARQNRH